MEVLRFNLGPLDNNTYVLADSGQAVIIDPSFDSASIIPEIESRGLQISAVLNTHAHIDHVVENALFVERYGVPLALHGLDRRLLDALEMQAAWMGIPAPRPSIPLIDLAEKTAFPVGQSEVRIVHTPGHSPGHICLLGDGIAIVGDVLFQGSIGRTDLPGGSYPRLMQSIQEVLLPLPDETVIYPGHGPTTTLVREKTQNPFLLELLGAESVR
jgi:glyoxylase-like metal-dependent hydrolase (beta-lactamase superfamily II)